MFHPIFPFSPNVHHQPIALLLRYHRHFQNAFLIKKLGQRLSIYIIGLYSIFRSVV
ncbi:unnamed protein product [Protopolystoma xenopodis]|uniref:Uncharacterized protein n=1 Tax=Protopolystoma xenopodis TaxID=117903 RepID=A0A3S5ALW2_9PLAT|nr:unnamed protein product [Protopolystoma xenopodis]